MGKHVDSPASSTPISVPADVELRCIDFEKNRFRVYGFTDATSLFGECCLVIAWGRIGAKVKTRTEVFTDAVARDRRKRELLARRKRHGYQVCATDHAAAVA